MKIKYTFTPLHLFILLHYSLLLLISPFEFSHVQFFSRCRTLRCLLQLPSSHAPPLRFLGFTGAERSW
ncbi:hypothetical protein LDENG_00194160 [Lucifuga dentata]|nr:hypothetical protein LDENG_00194160 [Lucifuga dentata]